MLAVLAVCWVLGAGCRDGMAASISLVWLSVACTKIAWQETEGGAAGAPALCDVVP